jgi:hypothetical protein
MGLSLQSHIAPIKSSRAVVPLHLHRVVLDWAHYGYQSAPSVEHKKTASPSTISKLTVLGGATLKAYTGNLARYSWSDGDASRGTPHTATATPTGVYVAGTGKGFRFSVRATHEHIQHTNTHSTAAACRRCPPLSPPLPRYL